VKRETVIAEPSPQRVGLIVPSSNVTMEIEIPALLRKSNGEFSFHASRMAMRQVSAAELKDMDAQAERCAHELAHARIDALAYACLVAVMVQGPGAHRRVQARLRAALEVEGLAAPVTSSAGALVETLRRLRAGRIAIVAPYMPALTRCVIDYLAAEGVTTIASRSLQVSDNLEVGRIRGDRIEAAVAELESASADVLVLSACVQMPSLGILQKVQANARIPVITAASSTAAALLHSLGRDASVVPGGAGLAWSAALEPA